MSHLPEPDAPPGAADRRVPGERGLATRRRLLEATRSLLEVRAIRDLKVVDIAREAATSPATFYQYFPDVDAATLDLAREMAEGSSHLPQLVRSRSWRGAAAWESSVAVIDAFLVFWEKHRALLRVVDLHADEGDQRFRQVRVRMLASLTDALAEVMVRHRASKPRRPDDPRAVGGVLVSMLARVAQRRYGFEFGGIRTDDLRAAMARHLYWGITGQSPRLPTTPR